MRAICAIVASLVLAGTTFGDTINVPAEYPTIQGAIDAASEGDEIIVGPGTYTGTGESVINTQGKDLLFRSSQGPAKTIIDSEGARRGIVCENDMMVFDGFAIINGYGVVGGGMRCGFRSAAVVRNCIFQNNFAEWGGAINNSGSIEVVSCIFNLNQANSVGGAIDNNYGGHSSVVDSIFTVNSANGAGGAMHNNLLASVTLGTCSFINNTAFDGGAIKSLETTVTIHDCTFTGNEASDSGDADWQGRGGSMQSLDCTTNITNSIFQGGAATFGSGVHVSGGTLQVLDTEFTQNAGGAGALEGDLSSWTVIGCDFGNNSAFWNGAAINTSWGIELEIDNCVFAGNQSNFNGGAIRTLGAISTMTNCTFTNNIASTSTNPDYYGDGGAIKAISGTLAINESTFDHNQATLGTAIHVDGGSLDLLHSSLHQNDGGTGAILSHSASLEIVDCDFFGNTVYWDGGAINAQFGDLNIDNCLFEENQSLFFGGGIRIYEADTQISNSIIANNTANKAAGGIYAINALVGVDNTIFCGNNPDHIVGDIDGSNVEFLSECTAACPGDANGDFFVDVNDVLYLISAWDTADPNADFDGDGLVDADDVLILLSHYGESCP